MVQILQSRSMSLSKVRPFNGVGRPTYIFLMIIIVFFFFIFETGTIFDVSAKSEIYGPGKSYGVFAGKDGSKGLGMSSLDPKDAIPDYSELSPSDMGVLNDWHAFFTYVVLWFFFSLFLIFFFKFT